MPDDKQHWVPKFLVKAFADVDGRVFCLNIHSDQVTKPPPKHAASEIAFNEFVIAGRPVSFEDKLEKIETRAAPILRKIVKMRSLAGLGERDRLCVADFAAAQSFRTQAFYKSLGASPSRREFGAVFAALWRSAFLLSDEIVRRRWALMVIEHDAVFYLGDHPIVLQHTERPASMEALGFDIKGVEAFLPLSPKCALYLPCRSISREILSGYEKADRIHRTARAYAMRGQCAPGVTPEMLRLCQRVLMRRPLYEALASGTALVAAPENVENVNYLQCAWAQAAVYSNRKDFDFARKVFRRTPEYRETPKVRLETFGSGEPFSIADAATMDFNDLKV